MADSTREVPPTIPTQSELDPGQPDEVACLTLLYHPDLRRVGERSLLYKLARGATVELSRTEPEFVSSDDIQLSQTLRLPRPLDDPYLSARRPIRIEPCWPTGIAVAPADGAKLTIDGEPVHERVTLSRAQVREGVVLALFKRVVVLLHMVEREREQLPRFGLVGHSEAIHAVRRAIANVADLDVPVLIRGESGTGKELVARAIHDASRRARGAYVALNMSAIPETLAESQLFGHEKGAFSGAAERRVGFFEQAAGGTLFLDEIGDTPPEVQVVMLRALETGEIQPVGGSPRKVDVRVIAATEIDLEGAQDSGAFRAALLHRLAGFEVAVPPLRARRDDIARLVVYFLERELSRTGERRRLEPPAHGKSLWFPPALMERLVAHDWSHGNVRALANAIRQLVVSSRGADRLDAKALDARLGAGARTSGSAVGSAVGAAPSPPRGAAARAISDDELVAVMKQHGYRIGQVASALGIPKSTAHDLVDKCPLLRKANDIPREELVASLEANGGDLRAVSEALMVALRALKIRLRQLDLL